MLLYLAMNAEKLPGIDDRGRRRILLGGGLARVATALSPINNDGSDAETLRPEVKKLVAQQENILRALCKFGEDAIEPTNLPAAIAAFRCVQNMASTKPTLADTRKLIYMVLFNAKLGSDGILNRLSLDSKNPSNYISSMVKNHVATFSRGCKVLSNERTEPGSVFERYKAKLEEAACLDRNTPEAEAWLKNNDMMWLKELEDLGFFNFVNIEARACNGGG
jgi:hypothetical protein